MPPPARALSSCAAAHDATNVPCLLTIASLCLAGLAGVVDPLFVTHVFLVYMVIDGAWIACFPRAVPSAARAVVVHHVVASTLLLHVVMRPERAMETCRNGLVEGNTLALILRRRAARGTSSHRVWHALYVSTLVPVRFVWQPYLLWRFFFVVTKDDVIWERAAVCGAQLFLLGFNVFLVARRRLATEEKKTA
jgi:hypothetical protein